MSLFNKDVLQRERDSLERDEDHSDVIKLLDSEGYTHHINGLPSCDGCITFQKQIDDGVTALCHTNDKLFMNVEVWNVKNHKSVSVKMCHQNSEGQWFELVCYGNSPYKFVNEYRDIFNRLYSAWQVVYNLKV